MDFLIGHYICDFFFQNLGWSFYIVARLKCDGSLLARATNNTMMRKIWDSKQGLSQELETGCLKFAIVKFLGDQIFKGNHNIVRFQP